MSYFKMKMSFSLLQKENPLAPHTPQKTLSLSWNLWQTVDFICIETELEVGGVSVKKNS